HFLDEPARAVEQAARTVWAGGRLLIVDFAPHHLDALRTEHGHRRLGFTDAEVVHWCTAAGMAPVTVSHIALPDPGPDSLTVTVWVATQAANAPVVRNLEVA
ncbi:MAG: ArsR family transcriptional regulator, partial [Acidimicrobiia bacterium]|nr:ArsR family transcriptional regulator [Acidimicrobiia bacterium]